MPTIIPGYTTEQKVVTSANDDTSMNAVITAEAVDSWLVEEMILSGSNVIFLFTRTIASIPLA